jgi:hypothetical protein
MHLLLSRLDWLRRLINAVSCGQKSPLGDPREEEFRRWITLTRL